MLRNELGGMSRAQAEQWTYTCGSRHQSSLGTQRCVPAADLVSLKMEQDDWHFSDLSPVVSVVLSQCRQSFQMPCPGVCVGHGP